MRKVLFLLIIIFSPGMLAGVAQAQTRDLGVHGELLDRIAAVVNDGLVLKSELDAQTEVVTKRLQEQNVALPPPSVLRQQVLDRLKTNVPSAWVSRSPTNSSTARCRKSQRATRFRSINCRRRSRHRGSTTSNIASRCARN
jgi:hypothetical protein